MLEKFKSKFKSTTNTTNKENEGVVQVHEENLNLIPLEEVNMSNYLMSEKIAKKIAPLNNMWTYSMNEDTDWNNELYYTKDNAIARGSAQAKQLGLTKFYIGRSVQNGLPIGTNALNILFQIKDSIVNLTQGQRTDYLKEINEKEVYELEDSLQLVVHEWLKRNNLIENFYLLDHESVQEVGVNNSPFSLAQFKKDQQQEKDD